MSAIEDIKWDTQRALYYLDIYTDIVLLITFCDHGWVYVSIFSAIALALPYLFAMISIFRIRKKPAIQKFIGDGLG